MSWNDATWKKYLEGKATKEELEELEAYLGSGNLEAWNVFIAKERLPDTPMPPDKEQELLQYLQQHKRSGRKRANILFIGRRITAAAAVVILAAAVWLLLSREHVTTQPTASVTGWDTVGRAANAIRRLTLPDGTHIWLNRQAELLVSKNYSFKRQVCLNGEGYFEIAEDAAHPFSVQTGQVSTVVLGTVFNIEHTSGDQAVRVSLIEGKVKVMYQKDTAAALTLLPGHMALAKEGGVRIIDSNPASDAGAWIKGDLVMNNIPLADALNKLSAYYSIKIAADPSLIKDKMITALYHRDQPWAQVLRHLLLITQLTYTTDKNGTIHITRN